MKKYVLTGGPGTGKSTLILSLEQMGEHTTKEAAEDYIKIRQAQGQPEPWTEQYFQEKILELQLKREARIPLEAERAFLDRGVVDGLAYTEDKTICRKIKEAERQAGYEKKVFLIEHLGYTEKTKLRRECHEEAIKLGQKIAKIYQGLGYEIIKIPAGAVEERLERILKES